MATVALRNLVERYFGASGIRRRAWSKHLSRVARRHDLLIYPHHLSWSLPGELTELESSWGDLPGLPLDCCQLLFSLARSVNVRGLPGDSAECGVRFGKSSFFILNGLSDAERAHHLCDSFEGLSRPAAVDAERYARRNGWREGDLAADERVTRAKLNDFPQCRFHRGWIPECFAGMENLSFAFVHIDVDLYAPTLAAFEFFYPRLVRGGVMVCDDYGFVSCPGARKAVDEFFANRKDVPIELPSGQALIFHG
jgi:O-methyltransferase